VRLEDQPLDLRINLTRRVLRKRLRLQVAGDSPAERAGLSAGDVIMTISRRAVRSADGAMRELGRAQCGEPVFVLVWRRGVELFLQMRKD
jgi:S1-C subfamily serine protease